MGEFLGARPPSAENAVRVTALDSQLFHAFGTELVTLQKTGLIARGIIACKVEVGAFRFRAGLIDSADNLTVPVAADHIVGDGSVLFAIADGVFYLSRPEFLVIQGTGASDILTYWFLP